MTWRWLQHRIAGLLNRPPNLVPVAQGAVVMHTTRLAFSLFPPETPKG